MSLTDCGGPERPIVVLSQRTAPEFPSDLGLPPGPFVCLISWDATEASDSTIRLLSERLLDAGAVYFCCGGADCERVHDGIDEALVDRISDESEIVTTWHVDEPLEEVLWFILNSAWPAQWSSPQPPPVLAVAIGEGRGEEVLRALEGMQTE